MAEQNEIIVLFEGYSKEDDVDPDSFMRANSTCTLIKAKSGYNVIVDTMTPWDGERILNALSEHSVEPKHITTVVCTHGHSDHTGNNNLFLNAKFHIVGQSWSCKDKYMNRLPNPFPIDGEIQVIETPGHTLSCCSVIVRNTNLGKEVAIAGDLFEKMEDIDDPSIWINAGSENERLQAENRLKVSETADVIIPGHGAPFKVTQEMRKKIRIQLQNY